jgi:hypothetical protein
MTAEGISKAVINIQKRTGSLMFSKLTLMVSIWYNHRNINKNAGIPQPGLCTILDCLHDDNFLVFISGISLH